MLFAITRKRSRSRSIEGFNHDGLELGRRRRVRRGFPLRELLLFGLAVVAFKILLASQMGLSGYSSKIANLSEGTGIERVAARVMILDPASVMVVEALLRGAAVVEQVKENNTRSF